MTHMTKFSVLIALSMSVNLYAADRPNVIVIYTDDQGTLDLNCYGSKDLITPNLDGLAERGVRFTQFYAPSAICSASRAGMITGRFPLRVGVPSNVSSKAGNAGLPAEEITMGDFFKEAGYRTAHIGKWHLGYTPETMPNGQGFDHSFGHMGGCIDNYSHFFYWNGPNRHDLWRNGEEIFADGQFFPDLMVKETEKFLTEKSDKPFFIYWAINTPHYPLQATDKWREKYKDVPYPRNLYGSFVSTTDERIGQVLSIIDQLKLTEETIVVYQSDHGHSTEERTHFGGGNAGINRGAKACLFEGGLKVPAIISWPGHIPEGEVRKQMGTGCDWFPTLADMCEIAIPQGHRFDGKSLKDVIMQNSDSPHPAFYWNMGGGKNPQWAVRRGNWKLLGNPRDTVSKQPVNTVDGMFLVDLENDPGETTNLAEAEPDKLKEMVRLRGRYQQSIAPQ